MAVSVYHPLFIFNRDHIVKMIHVLCVSLEYIYINFSSGEKTFSFIMSDILNLKNSDGDRVIVDDYCKVISQGVTRHEAMFRGDAYAEHRLYSMHFYVQLMLRTQGM